MRYKHDAKLTDGEWDAVKTSAIDSEFRSGLQKIVDKFVEVNATHILNSTDNNAEAALARQAEYRGVVNMRDNVIRLLNQARDEANGVRKDRED